MTWYYKDGEQEVGPLDKGQLQALIHAKQINARTLVRNDSMSDWRPLGEMVRGGAGASAPPPPPVSPPAEHIPNENGQAIEHPPVEAVSAQPVPVPETATNKRLPFFFKGSGGEYFKIWIVNMLLSIVTLGIYSAWAKVRRKQYFYGNTTVAGAAFRYLANPIKILKGRILAFFVFAIYTIVNQLLPPVGFLLTIALIIILPWLVVRSIAFNARNSAWRNIRFNFTGTYGGAAKVFIFFPILTIFTLGLLAPYVFFRQKKFIVENYAYGTRSFSFHARPGDYYRMVLIFMVPLILVIAAAASILNFLPDLSIIAMVLMAGLYLYAFAYFSVKSSNLLFNSSALQANRFEASMAVKAYATIVLVNTLATVLTLGFFYPFAVVRALRYKLQNLTLLPGGDLEQFVAAEIKETSAVGDELSDIMDFDFGF